MRVSGDSLKLHEMNPRKHRAASHKAGACASRMRCAGTPRPASPLTSPATPKRNTQEWQDSRIVHDSRGPCSEKTPSWQDLRAVYSRKAICRAFRIHGARILPKSAHFGCMAAICCQEGALFPSEAPFGIHEAQNLPRIAARERTRAKDCHRQAPENARGVTEPGDATRTKHRPIQHRMLTRPRNHENILVPSAKKRR